jgi:hypothetical protein
MKQHATLLPPGSTSANPTPDKALQGLEDHELGAEIKHHQSEGRSRWHVIANAFAVRVFATENETTPWCEVGSGDLGNQTLNQLNAAARGKRLSWASVQVADLAQTPLDVVNPELISVAKVNEWIKRRDKVTTGRQGEISASVMTEVRSLAAWRCQFEGCGENLRTHLVPGTRGNYAYFAHIVASSLDGPRGDPNLSAQLCNDPANILLLCDKCHRLIDRIAPHQYPRERLQNMRERNLASVERCLESLRYPLARVLVLGGNVQGQSAGFDERLAQEAMWLQRLRRDNTRPDFFANNGGHLGDPHSPAYWASFFVLLRSDIPRLQSILNGTSQDSPQGMPIAVFPAPHTTSVLILTGRLLGESRSIHLFQFHRDQVGGTLGGQWAWNGEVPSKDKYKVTVLHPFEPGHDEATMLIYLTDIIPSDELPVNLYENGQWKHPTIQVTVEHPSRLVIAHPEDLQLFGLAVDGALQAVQDQWRVSKVNLVVIAPITACVRVGQKMQARCQPDFVLYELTATAGRGSFAPTICISSQDVTHVQTVASCPLI